MKKAFSMLAALAAILALAALATVQAQDKKEEDKDKELKGTICCAKCELKIDGQTKCATVIKVKEGDKDVVYWFDPKADKEHHKKICTTPMKGVVKGTVKKDGDKLIITVKELKFAD